MLGNLALSPEAAMLAGASGSVIIKYVNSSYFWVCTSLSKLTWLTPCSAMVVQPWWGVSSPLSRCVYVGTRDYLTGKRGSTVQSHLQDSGNVQAR